MIILYHGVQPYRSSRHVGMMEAYGRRLLLVYVDVDTVTTPPPGQFDRLESALADPNAHGIVPVELASTIPGGRIPIISRLNRWIALRRLIRMIRQRRPIREPVVVVSQRPDLLPAVGLPGDLWVYEVRDDYVGLIPEGNTARRKRMQRAHERVLRRADLVWAISATLVEDIRPIRPDVIRTRVGVEFEAFASARESDAPDVLRRIGRPRIGLLGNLNERVDWELLERLCERRPEWQIVVVGPLYGAGPRAQRGLAALCRQPNGHHVGAVPRSQLASVIAAFDVCMIPYRLDRVTTRINSLKLYQYLAAGKPVVAVGIPSIRELEDVVACYENEQECVAAIEKALAGGTTFDVETRRARARQFEWQAVADHQIRILEQRLGRA